MDTLCHKLTIVVVTHNSMSILPLFLNNLYLALADNQCDILICDNGSQDGIADFIKSHFPHAVLLKCDDNEGYGAALNRGINNAKTPFIALMNPDVVVVRGGFKNLVEFLEGQPMAAGISGAVVHLSEIPNNIEHAHVPKQKKIAINKKYSGIINRVLFYSGLQTRFRRFKWLVDWSLVDPCDSISVTRLNGSFGVFRKEALIKAGLFDPRLFLYFEEDDIALRLINIGYKLYVTNRAVIFHTPGKGSSIKNNINLNLILLNSQYIFFKKHYGLSYAWIAFFTIWLILILVYIYQKILSRSGMEGTANLLRWHFESLLRGGGLPDGTIPDGGKKGVDYKWTA